MFVNIEDPAAVVADKLCRPFVEQQCAFDKPGDQGTAFFIGSQGFLRKSASARCQAWPSARQLQLPSDDAHS